MTLLALRSLAGVALCAGAAALAGCGGSEGSGGALEDSVSYLPKDSPFVASISTDLEGEQAKAIEKIAARFPLAGQARKGLEQSLSEGDVDFEQDVKPALGNELVAAGTNARTFTDDSEDDDFVAAIQAKDGKALDGLVEKSRLKEVGEVSGAKLYESKEGDVSAIEGDVVVFGGSRELVEAALERHDGDDHLDENALDDATEDLPEDALVRFYFNAQELIANEPGSEDARKVKWVRALRTVGFAASFEDDAVNVDFRANTDGEELSEQELPIAAGTESPPVIERPGEIGVGLRDLEQILTFGEAAAQAVDPASFGDYSAGKETIERRLDVDIENDLLAQLDEVSATFSLAGGFGVRAGVKDEAAFERTLERIGPAAAKFAEGALGESVGYVKPKRSGGFYALATADRDSIVYGVKDGVLVLANDDARAGALSSAQTEMVQGAEGAVSVSFDAQRLATQVIARLGVAGGLGGAAGGSRLTEPLGDLTGSVFAEPEGITGSFTLKFD